MSDKLQSAPLIPVMMVARCPHCHAVHELEEHEWQEDESGAFVPEDAARFPVCGECGQQFEIAGIDVSELPA